MKHIRISTKEIVQDIRSGMSDGALMEKYGLSVRSLPKVKMELHKLGLTVPGEAEAQTRQSPISPKISIKAQDFLARFQETPDDFALMEAYGLNVAQLQAVYKQLIGKRLLSEFEFHNRQKKAPDLQHMDLPEAEETTAIDLTQGLSGTLWDYAKMAGSPPGAHSPRKEPDRGGRTLAASGLSKSQRNRQSGPLGGPCPNCGKPMAPESPESCLHCGVVFAKAEVQRKKSGVAIWD